MADIGFSIPQPTSANNAEVGVSSSSPIADPSPDRKEKDELVEEDSNNLGGLMGGEDKRILGNLKNKHTKTMEDAQEQPDGLFRMEREVEEGNIEYKRSLVNPTAERLEHLTSQLKWRLVEGQGEALYELGVDDDGLLRGLTPEDMQKSIDNLKKMAAKLGAEVSTVCERRGKNGLVSEMLVRELREDKYLDVRFAVCGNVDSGKSTLIGVLTRGKLDNGRGAMRANVFQHKHELQTGRTSSISQQIMGFNTKGECVNCIEDEHKELSWGDIIEQSYKVVSFFDLAGHERYLKTTVSGMTGQMPDYCFLLIGANMGVTKMTKEHLGLALALKIPVIVLITKIDICPENVLKETLNDIQRILRMRGVKKMSIVIRNTDDLMTSIHALSSDRTVPIFLISSVTGTNLDLLRKFLNVVPPRIQWDVLKDKPPEVLIDQTYFVTGVGTVLGGTVMAGVVNAGDTLLLGPDGNGLFEPVQIKSVHSKRVPVKAVTAGQSAGFAIKKIRRSQIRKGMVLVDTKSNPKATWAFEADVIVLYHSTTIHTNYQPVVQCMTMRQSAKITAILEREVLRTGDRATVRFQFLYRPEYLKIGMRIIFREGRCKGIGIISKVQFEKSELVATNPDGTPVPHAILAHPNPGLATATPPAPASTGNSSSTSTSTTSTSVHPIYQGPNQTGSSNDQARPATSQTQAPETVTAQSLETVTPAATNATNTTSAPTATNATSAPTATTTTAPAKTEPPQPNPTPSPKAAASTTPTSSESNSLPPTPIPPSTTNKQ